ncbi:MAG: phosphoribosylformylglycinamidine cyclo-ligase [Planctomycetota bacterium]
MTYAQAGVDIEKADRLVDSFIGQMRRTFGPRVVDNPGGFAGLFSLDYDRKLFARNFRRPLLAATTDGVGTKLEVAQMMNVHDTVGIDLVAMSVNDLVVQGAEPLFFLDYIATGEIRDEVLVDVLKGIVAGCEIAGCALLGGETAEMPGFYRKGQYDLAGFAVGVVEAPKLLNGANMLPGDVVLGLASSGLHSNGYSLVRKVLLAEGAEALRRPVPELGLTLGEELLKPTRIYVRSLLKLLSGYRVKKVVRAFAHVTGSGLPGNLERVLGPSCRAEIVKGSWPVPPIFGIIQKAGDIEDAEMLRTFNMGVGMVVVVAPHFAASAARTLKRSGETVHEIGRIVEGERGVVLIDS